MKRTILRTLVLIAGLALLTMPALAQNPWWDELMNLPFPENYPTKQSSQVLLDEYAGTMRDANGEYLSGGASYRLSVPAHVPVNNFWSVTVYDAETASGLDNGQPFPSISSFDKQVANPDGSTDIYFGPSAPKGHEKNWLRNVPDKGYFVGFRLYGPTQTYFDKTWKLPDIEKIRTSRR